MTGPSETIATWPCPVTVVVASPWPAGHAAQAGELDVEAQLVGVGQDVLALHGERVAGQVDDEDVHGVEGQVHAAGAGAVHEREALPRDGAFERRPHAAAPAHAGALEVDGALDGDHRAAGGPDAVALQVGVQDALVGGEQCHGFLSQDRTGDRAGPYRASRLPR
jgi:hypothetical protein